ncbi:uncharacterized protein LOC135163924 [Diachasmimorpha longicaudata]|uniref:uncharacterized protein LOC135163924 n=1 Tax=Diachasmimorpha longicaudata TaxID=58733 RepID=UPI0030B88332
MVSTLQVHGFADASNLAIEAVVYLRTEKPGTAPVISRVCAKTRVAPLKTVTIPRLELTATGLLTELTSYAIKELEPAQPTIFLRTDSSVALAWVKSHPSRCKEHVLHCVVKIQEAIPNGAWLHISGTDNPADYALRGLSPEHLHHHPLWWNGPRWIVLPPHHWPVSSVGSTAAAALEEKLSSADPVVIGPQKGNELLERHNDLNKILLTPYLDHQQILQIGGRLHNAHLDFEEIHPTVLPRHSRFTDLVIGDAHRRSHHGRTQLTLAFTRQRYWIIGGRARVRIHIHQYAVCVRNRGELAQ